MLAAEPILIQPERAELPQGSAPRWLFEQLVALTLYIFTFDAVKTVLLELET